MTDIVTVKFQTKNQNSVIIEYEDGRIVSGPWPLQNEQHREEVENWLAGRDDAWLLANEQYQQYQDIVTFDQRLEDYRTCIANTPDETPSNCGARPMRPLGYYTPLDVSRAKDKHDEWLACEALFPGGCGNPPLIPKLPNELPVVPAPPATTPNTIQPWMTPAEELAEAKAIRKQHIDRARDQSLGNGFSHAGHEFASDAASVQRIIGGVLMAVIALLNNQPFSIDWITKDDQTVTLDAQGMISLGLAYAQAHETVLMHTARGKRNAIDQAASVAEVNAVDWEE